MLHQLRVLSFSQTIQNERVAHLHQRLDRAILGDRDGHPQRLERRLRHPRGNHGSLGAPLGVGVSGCHNVEPTRHASESLGDVRRHGALLLGNHVLLCQGLGQICARLLKLLIRHFTGSVFHPKGGRKGLQARRNKRGRQLVDGLVTPTKALRDDDNLLRLDRREQCSHAIFRLRAIRWVRHQHNGGRTPDGFDQLLLIDGQQIHHLRCHLRLSNTPGQSLTQPIAVSVV
mmetsp:Transcript_13006/g.37488  ORF Transcript_13006/g.37488 Transcript_13006/m.37488 type:complete len:230 (+) Transcript_13006:1945-2634(+)